MIRILAAVTAGTLLGAGVTWYVLSVLTAGSSPPPTTELTVIERPLDRFAIDALNARTPQAGPIELEQAVATSAGATSYRFSFRSEGKRVTGLMHIPNRLSGEAKAPVIIQFRGYMDREAYVTGDGTRRSAAAYAQAGFISVAPDFLGYGGSDAADGDILLERLRTYTTALDLIEAVKSYPQADAKRIGLWGHSNGGHIAATVLTITKGVYPTVLWAPVSKPFPYSVLYFTDELPDGGKFLRRELAKFEQLYDVDKYAFPNYLTNINAPLLIHQGSADEAVPIRWTDEFVATLQKADKDVRYIHHPGADHNMNDGAGSWNLVVAQDIDFYKAELK